jgi:alpha-tubulin suppressor-like RCC1 family protein
MLRHFSRRFNFILGVVMLLLPLCSSSGFAQTGYISTWGEAIHGDGLPLNIRKTPIQLSLPTNIVQAGRGTDFTVALTATGTVWAWGENSAGQLGNGTFTRSFVPQQISNLTDVKQIAVNWMSSLALRKDGTVWEWGGGKSTPSRISNLARIKQVALGHEHGIALDIDGYLWAWGANSSGQLGDSTRTARPTPFRHSPGTQFVHIATVDYTTVAIGVDGSVWTCGQNSGDDWGPNVAKLTLAKLPNLNGFVEAVCSVSTNFVRKGDGTTFGWGANQYGQLGDGTYVAKSVPTLIPGLSGAVQICGGIEFTYRLNADGTVSGVGVGIGTTFTTLAGVRGIVQLGHGWYPTLAVGGRIKPLYSSKVVVLNRVYTSAMRILLEASLLSLSDGTPLVSEPVFFSVAGTEVGVGWTDNNGTARIVLPPTFASGSYLYKASYLGNTLFSATNASATFSVIQHDPLLKGMVNAWGLNVSGQLGDGTTISAWETAVSVMGLFGVTQVAGGWQHSLGLTSDGKVWAWGVNYDHLLGDGTTETRSFPVMVKGLSGVVEVAGGLRHSLALKSDGTVWQWGAGIPLQQVAPLTGIVQIRAGEALSLALKSDGTVWAWGENQWGQLGDGTTTNRTTPVQVVGLTKCVQIACGSAHAFGVTTEGVLWAWGFNGSGELGDGTKQNRAVPVQITALTNVKQISAGVGHSSALTTDGSYWSWGYNGEGALGDGTRISTTLPTKRTNLTGVVQMSAKGFAFILKSDGTVWRLQSPNPTQIGGLSSQASIASGYNHLLSLIPVTRLTEALIATRTRQYAEPYDLQSIARIAGTSVTLPMKKIDYFVDELNSGSGVTDAGGKTVVAMRRNLPVGTHTIKVRVNGDALYRASISAKNFDVVKANTTLLAITTLARYAETKSLKALFKRNSDKATPAGVKIDFAIDGVAVGSANTDATGTALLPVTFGLGVLSLGDHTVTATYLGDSNHNASSSTGKLTISKALTSITSISTSGKTGATVTLKGVLVRNIGNSPLSGGVLKFSVNGVLVGTGTTSATGLATLSYQITQGVGTYKIKVEFAGDARHEAVINEKATLTVN